ncbi:MAG: DUF5011 domain-containing protein [Pseudomonadota bacterium]
MKKLLWPWILACSLIAVIGQVSIVQAYESALTGSIERIAFENDGSETGNLTRVTIRGFLDSRGQEIRLDLYLGGPADSGTKIVTGLAVKIDPAESVDTPSSYEYTLTLDAATARQFIGDPIFIYAVGCDPGGKNGVDHGLIPGSGNIYLSPGNEFLAAGDMETVNVNTDSWPKEIHPFVNSRLSFLKLGHDTDSQHLIFGIQAYNVLAEEAKPENSLGSIVFKGDQDYWAPFSFNAHRFFDSSVHPASDSGTDTCYTGAGSVYYSEKTETVLNLYRGKKWAWTPGHDEQGEPPWTSGIYQSTSKFNLDGLSDKQSKKKLLYKDIFSNQVLAPVLAAADFTRDTWNLECIDAYRLCAAEKLQGNTCECTPFGTDISAAPLVENNDYFYLYFSDIYPWRSDFSSAIGVARAEKNTLLTSAGFQEKTPFYKYFKGQWSSKGIHLEDALSSTDGDDHNEFFYGGNFTPIISALNDPMLDPVKGWVSHPDVKYSSYLNQYIMAYMFFDGFKAYGIALRTSDNGVTHWSNPTYIDLLTVNADEHPGAVEGPAFPTLAGVLTDTNHDMNVINKAFYVYYLPFPDSKTLSRVKIISQGEPNKLSADFPDNAFRPIPVTEAGGVYGNCPENTQYPDLVEFSLNGAPGDLTVRYQAYDIDDETEVEVLINGIPVGIFAPVTGNNTWGEGNTMVIPGRYVNDAESTILTFHNTRNPSDNNSTPEIWGIRNVTLVKSVSYSASAKCTEYIPLPALGPYGNKVPEGEINVNDVRFSFPGMPGDLILFYEGFDVDENSEVQILINGTAAGYMEVTPNKKWGGMQSFPILDALVNDTSQNILTFNCTENPPKKERWGIRTVSVLMAQCFNDDVPPVVTLLGDNPMVIGVAEIYQDPGATAQDTCDGDLTDKIIVANPVNTSVAGFYEVTYTVSDSTGNQAEEVSRIVEVSHCFSDTTPPVITLIGENTITLCSLAPINHPGVTAMDNCDGDLTDKIQTTPMMTKFGYVELYQVKDSSGNLSEIVNRIFKFVDCSQYIPLPAEDAYGWFATDQDPVLKLDFSFDGTPGDVILFFEGFNIDNSTKIEILINGESAGYAATTPANLWGDSTTVILPDTLVNDLSLNVLTFNCTTNPPNGSTWGVRNLSLLPESECIPLPAAGSYGNGVPDGEPHVKNAHFLFEGMTGDVIINYEGFDIDSPTKVEIFINGNSVGYVPETPDNLWGDATTVILPNDFVNDSSLNVLSFNCTADTPENLTWGVRNLNAETAGCSEDIVPPRIILLGDNPMVIGVGEIYQDPGATAQDTCDGDLTYLIIVDNPVDTNVAGTYQVTYNVTDAAGNTAQEIIRTVEVNPCFQDTIPPVITLLGGNPLIIGFGQPFQDPGATAQDICDGDLTSRIIITSNTVNTDVEGSYQVIYSVMDSSFNIAVPVIREVVVDACLNDTTPPVITLHGDNPLLIGLGQIYQDPGATAQDTCDGNLTDDIIVNSPVNTEVAGFYQVTYTVVDKSGNEAIEVSRTVEVGECVVDTIPPVITLIGENPIILCSFDNLPNPGVTAIDNCDSDPRILDVYSQGLPDPDTYPATYKIGHMAIDSAGNASEVVYRTYERIDCSQYIPLPALNAFGRFVIDQAPVDHFDFSFQGTPGDVIIFYEGFNIDTEIKLQFFINGVPAGYGVTTPPNVWGNANILILPDDAVNDYSINSLTVKVNEVPYSWVWGIRNISALPESECIPLPAPGSYGNGVPDGEPHVNDAHFLFEGMTGDGALHYEGFDIDSSTKVEILINGNSVGYAFTTPPNSWGDGAMVILPDTFVNDSSINVLSFNCTANPPDNLTWGVRNLSALMTDCSNDIVPPVITLLGDNPLTIGIGEMFEDPGASAKDTCDGDLTDQILTDSSVNTDVAGTYQVTYTVTDSAGNKAQQVIRIVEVNSCSQDTIPPVITLNGDNPLIIGLGQTFQDPGATAQDTCDGDLTGQIITKDSVDTYMTGFYQVTYNVTDTAGNTAQEVIRTVEVSPCFQDTFPPVITLSGENPIIIGLGQAFHDPGATAQDACDGDLTNIIIVNNPVNAAVPGFYKVTYAVTDSSGNKAISVSRTVEVNQCLGETTPPVITLIGPNPIALTIGSTYLDPGAFAQDACDGDLTDKIVVNNLVNPEAEGDYQVTYTVTDSKGNKAQQVSRTVHISPLCWNCAQAPPAPHVVNGSVSLIIGTSSNDDCWGDCDQIPPVITLVGENPFYLPLGKTFIDPGAVAVDNYDGNLTPGIVISGTVNSNGIGTYTLRYDVQDTSGNQAEQVTRTVIVYKVGDYDELEIVLSGPNPITIYTDDKPYVDPGYEVFLNNSIAISGDAIVIGSNNVDRASPGIYEVSYVATMGIISQKATRTVIVTDVPSNAITETSYGYDAIGRVRSITSIITR